MRTVAGKEKKARLERGDGDEEEPSRFYRLRQAYNDWNTHLKRIKKPEKITPPKRIDYTPGEIDDLYEKYLNYRRKFEGPWNKTNRDRVQSEQCPPEELQRFKDLKDAHKEYRRVTGISNKSSKPIRSQFTPIEREQLEALRPDGQAFVTEFWEKGTKGKRPDTNLARLRPKRSNE